MAMFGRAKEGFLRRLLPLRRGVPSHDTFGRVFRPLDPERFEACFSRFMRRFAEAAPGVVAVDGKTLHRSYDRAAGASPLHLVSAWACGARLVLGQVAVEDGSNGIAAVPELLRMLSLRGHTVTVDAMGCQRAIAAQVVAQDGDDVLALEGNQGTLHADVRLSPDDPEHVPKLARGRDVDAGHGRIETREASVCADVGWLEGHAWPDLAAVGKVERTREAGGGTSRETAYFLLSAALSSERFGEVVRAHRGIENALHWVLDVSMGEDDNRSRTGHGPRNLALLRRWALMGAGCDGVGRVRGIEQGQVQARRLGRRLPHPPPRISPETSRPAALNSAERHMR